MWMALACTFNQEKALVVVLWKHRRLIVCSTNPCSHPPRPSASHAGRVFPFQETQHSPLYKLLTRDYKWFFKPSLTSTDLGTVGTGTYLDIFLVWGSRVWTFVCEAYLQVLYLLHLLKTKEWWWHDDMMTGSFADDRPYGIFIFIFS